MGFKPITLATIGAYHECLRQDHNGHTLSQADFDIVSQCFEETFVEDAPIPPDPPIGSCANGYRAGSGLWSAYCLDEPSKFLTEGQVMVMGQNADGVTKFPGGRKQRGTLRFDLFFATAVVPQGTGGLHIGSLTSAHKAWNSPVGSPNYRGWLRPDWQIVNGDGTNAELRIGTYIADAAGSNLQVRTWNTGVILRPGQWIPLKFGWDRVSPTELRLTVNDSAPHGVSIYSDCEDLRGWKFGNMDGLDEFGGEPEVRFRNIVLS